MRQNLHNRNHRHEREENRRKQPQSDLNFLAADEASEKVVK
jgi:hypothetical protein